jgi:hypothetical protein
VPATGAIAGPALGGYERTIDLATSPVEVRLHYDAAPGSSALTGEGSIGTRLPGDGHLLLRVPHVVGRGVALLDPQLAASYPLVHEDERLPSLSVVAQVDLPMVPGARGARPGVKAIASKDLGGGFIHAIRFESEVKGEGPALAPSYRTAIGTSLRLRADTTGTVDLVALRPPTGSTAEREVLAQLSLVHALRPNTMLRLSLGAGPKSGASALRSTVGIDMHF